MINLNVDQNGIPYRGFIKADKMRARQEVEHFQSPGLVPDAQSTENTGLLDSLASSRASMMGVVALLVLSVTVAYLLGENRGLSNTRGDTGAGQEMVDAVSAGATTEVDTNAVLMDEIAKEKNKVSRQIVQQEALQQEVVQSTRQSLLRLKQTLGAQTSGVRLNVNSGEMDDYSLSLSDPLSGRVVNQADFELEKLRLRVISMIDDQSETAIGSQ